MSNPQLDNPAARLVTILERFHAQPPNTPAIEAWAEVLLAEDDIKLLRRQAELMALIMSTCDTLRELPDQEEPDFLVSQLEDILDKFAARYGTVRSQTKAQWDDLITPVLIHHLHYCSIAIRRWAKEAMIEQGGIDQLLEDVREWIGEISRTSSIPRDDKMFIIGRLRDVEAALLGYFIGGFENVRVAVSALIGTAVVCESAHDPSFLTRVQQLWQKVVGFARGVQAISNAAEGTTSAIEAVSKL